MRVMAFFKDHPDGEKDKLCRQIFERHYGKPVGSGTYIPTGERDIEYEVPTDSEIPCKRELVANGFRLDPSLDGGFV